ncbi:MAG: AbrB/MazE/SpoVT family DNA-binding domain-containing protein [Candidatus Woesearchaeota archaeon]
MKRKVMQVADSTYLISLPMKWVKEHKIKKGDELDIQAEGYQLTIRSERATVLEEREIELKNFSIMTERTIHALYKKGVDLITILVEDPKDIERIQKSINKETVGYEIVDQSSNSCTIRSVASHIGEFDNLLKRIFLVQMTMGKDSLSAIEKKEFERLKQVKYLEETNNRLTTLCRRAINKQEEEIQKVGPMYYIIEDMENLADEYKYMFDFILEQKNLRVSNKIKEIYADVNQMMEDFYKLFYQFDEKIVVKLGNERKRLIQEMRNYMEKCNNKVECRMLHHLEIIAQKIFCLVGPSLVLTL